MNSQNKKDLRPSLSDKKTVVIKLSGKVLEDDQALTSFCSEVAELDRQGIKVVVVHGGGKQLDRITTKLGVEQKRINGRRITCEETLNAAIMVFAGKLNKDLTAKLRSFAVKAVGMSGVDGQLIEAIKRPLQKVECIESKITQEVDFGFVGDVVSVDLTVIDALHAAGCVPVVASLGGCREGGIYNINADTVASVIASEMKVGSLVYLTDVEGIFLDFNDKSSRLGRISEEDVNELVEKGSLKGGMLPKVASILHTISQGVSEAHVLSAFGDRPLTTSLLTDEEVGTVIYSQPSASQERSKPL